MFVRRIYSAVSYLCGNQRFIGVFTKAHGVPLNQVYGGLCAESVLLSFTCVVIKDVLVFLRRCMGVHTPTPLSQVYGCLCTGHTHTHSHTHTHTHIHTYTHTDTNTHTHTHTHLGSINSSIKLA